MLRIVLILASLIGLWSSGSEAREIKIATLAPDGSAWMVAMREAAKAVEQGSEGRLRFKFYPAGVMGADATVLRKIRLGQLQGAALTGSEASLVESNAAIYSLPFLLRDEAELEHVRARVDPLLAERFAASGMRVLSINSVGFAYLMSTQAIRNSADLRSAKVWVPQNDRVAEVTFRSGGVSPIALPLGDVFTSLQTGLIDTVANTWSGAIGLQWHTRLKYAVDLPLTMVMGYVLIDGKVMERIDAADQALLLRSFSEASQRTDARFRKDNQGAFSALQRQGVEVLSITEDDATHWRAIGAKAAEELSRAGTIDPALLAEVEAVLAAHRKGSISRAH